MTTLVAPVFCLQCARPAWYIGDSLLPDRPLVTCHWTNADGSEHGHGRTPGTWDQAEAQALVDERRERTRRENHKAGRHDGKPVPECPDCQRALYHQGHLKRRYIDPDCAACRSVPEPPDPLWQSAGLSSPRSRRGR